VCIALCTTVAQNRPDNFPYYHPVTVRVIIKNLTAIKRITTMLCEISSTVAPFQLTAANGPVYLCHPISKSSLNNHQSTIVIITSQSSVTNSLSLPSVNNNYCNTSYFQSYNGQHTNVWLQRHRLGKILGGRLTSEHSPHHIFHPVIIFIHSVHLQVPPRPHSL